VLKGITEPQKMTNENFNINVDAILLSSLQ